MTQDDQGPHHDTNDVPHGPPPGGTRGGRQLPRLLHRTGGVDVQPAHRGLRVSGSQPPRCRSAENLVRTRRLHSLKDATVSLVRVLHGI